MSQAKEKHITVAATYSK